MMSLVEKTFINNQSNANCLGFGTLSPLSALNTTFSKSTKKSANAETCSITNQNHIPHFFSVTTQKKMIYIYNIYI